MRALISGLAFLVAFSAAAEPEENEALVMRLIFDDCVGYASEEKTPFEGLDLKPLSPEDDAALDRRTRSLPNRRYLLSESYYAIWGRDAGVRICMIRPVTTAEGPMLLLVNPDGFLDRVTARAAVHGMTEADVGEEFSPFYLNSWREPGGDGELRVTVSPTAGSSDSPLLDAGLIIVAAGVDRVPRE
ncbi:MAG: hypothetical protein ACK5MQ_03130 [Pikeienuella sp.]